MQGRRQGYIEAGALTRRSGSWPPDVPGKKLQAREQPVRIKPPSVEHRYSPQAVDYFKMLFLSDFVQTIRAAQLNNLPA